MGGAVVGLLSSGYCRRVTVVALLLLGIPYLVAFRAQIHIFQICVIISHVNNLGFGLISRTATALIAGTLIIWAPHCMNPR
jgi:hypothetical protein